MDPLGAAVIVLVGLSDVPYLKSVPWTRLVPPGTVVRL